MAAFYSSFFPALDILGIQVLKYYSSYFFFFIALTKGESFLVFGAVYILEI